MYRVVIKKNDRKALEKELGENPVSIGSAKESEIFLDGPDVAGEHAVISVLGNRVVVEDSGSGRQTLLNGIKITTNFVEEGDVITIGAYSLTVEKVKQEAPFKEIKKLKPDLPKDPPEDRSTQNPALRDWLAGGESSKAGKPSDEKTEIAIEEEEISGKYYEKTARRKTPGAGSDETIVVPLSPNPKLYLIDSEKKNVFFPIEKDETTIGRGENADIRIDDFSLSAKHAVIVKFDNVHRIVDQASTNGTRVNGEDIHEKDLNCHDIIEVGEIRFEFLEGVVWPISDGSEFKPFADPASAKNEDIHIRQGGAEPPTPFEIIKSFVMTKRGKLYLSAAAALVIAIGLIFILKPSKEQGSSVTGGVVNQIDQERAEKDRIILFNLERAKSFIKERKYDDAREALKIIIGSVDPNNSEAISLMQNIDDIKAGEEIKTREEAAFEVKKLAKIASLTESGKKFLAQNRFKEAGDAFREILVLDPGNNQAGKYLEQLSSLESRIAKEKGILKSKAKEIEALYYQGISYYEEGNYDAAAEALRKVVEFRSSDFYQSSAKVLVELEKKQVSNIEEQLLEIDSLLKNEELLKAENIVRSIIKRYPESEKAKNVFSKIHGQIVEKAKKVYGEGLVYEQVVEDTRSAIDSYEEVLKLLPDPEDEYHKKAKVRLQKLK